MNTISLNVFAAMRSDWHVGSGHGRTKQIDRAVVRDAAGLPFLPAKTLTGVLRERAFQIAEALDADQSGTPWLDWARWTFGSRPDRDPRDGRRGNALVSAALQTTALRICAAVNVSAVADHVGVTEAELGRATTVLRSGVTISKITGTAEPNQLRTEERARAGLELRGVWTIHSEAAPADLWPAVFLIQAAARLTHAVGGMRRRGAGEVDLTVEAPGFDDLEALAGLAVTIDEPKVLAPRPVDDTGQPAVVDAEAESASQATLAHVWNLFVTARSPLLIGSTTRGNTVTSATSIPGAVLLPVVTRALGVGSDAVRDARIVVTEATPAANGVHRSVPWPLTLTRKKGDEEGEVINALAPHPFDPKHKAPSGSYLAITPDGPVETTVDRVHTVHVSIDPGKDSELFVYEAVAPGTVFTAQVWLRGESTADHDELPKSARIGQSRKDDYGDVMLRWERASPSSPTRFDAGETFTVYLDSPALLRRSSGASDPSVERLLAVLGDRLSVGLTEVKPVLERRGAVDTVTVSRAAVPTRIDSWQTRWGLPRPSLIGLAAGSVVQVVADGDISADATAALADGVGDRTAEGFGRIRLTRAAEEPASLSVQHVPPISTDHDDTLDLPPDDLAIIRESVLIERMQSAARAFALDPDQREKLIRPGTRRSQLGVLRGLALGLSSDGGQAAFRHWAEGVQKIERRKNVWGDQLARLESLVEAVQMGRPVIWKLLESASTPGSLTSLAECLDDATQTALTRTALQTLVIEMTTAEAKEETR